MAGQCHRVPGLASNSDWRIVAWPGVADDSRCCWVRFVKTFGWNRSIELRIGSTERKKAIPLLHSRGWVVRSRKSSTDYLEPTQIGEAPFGRRSTLTSWLDRPLSRSACALGWLFATAVFIGPSPHPGRTIRGRCRRIPLLNVGSRPRTFVLRLSSGIQISLPGIARPGPFIAPLWPLLSGAFDAITRIGHNVPFPSHTVLGPHCSNASAAILSGQFDPAPP